MMQFLQAIKNQKIQQLELILEQGNTQNILNMEEEWWGYFEKELEGVFTNQAFQNIVLKTLSIGTKINDTLKNIQQKHSVDQQILMICGAESDQESQNSQQLGYHHKQWYKQYGTQTPNINEMSSIQNEKPSFECDPYSQNKAEWNDQLARMRNTLEQCEKQNTELMKRLVKSLERCSILIEKVEKLKQENTQLQTQDSNSMKYYQRLLSQNKKELKQKDEMIRLYEIKLQVYRGQKPNNYKLTDRESCREYPYTSEGILDRIQSLRILAKGKIKSKSNATQIEEIS